MREFSIGCGSVSEDEVGNPLGLLFLYEKRFLTFQKPLHYNNTKHIEMILFIICDKIGTYILFCFSYK